MITTWRDVEWAAVDAHSELECRLSLVWVEPTLTQPNISYSQRKRKRRIWTDISEHRLNGSESEWESRPKRCHRRREEASSEESQSAIDGRHCQPMEALNSYNIHFLWQTTAVNSGWQWWQRWQTRAVDGTQRVFNEPQTPFMAALCCLIG